MLYFLCSKLPLRSGLETESASIENSTTASSSNSNVLANQACTSEERFKYEGEEEFVHSLFGGTETKMKLAENRLESTKRKLIATGKFEEYQDVLDLWLSEKIIEEVNDDKENFVHYLPHRPVIKENSTSKIRYVFDASARTKGSPSLNDCLEKGPNFIEVIPTILNRFRKCKIGVISDIEKAFLQIGVREQDRDFLRFMWYDRENRDHIKIYRHRRVVFGVTFSPFLLGATLNHHLDNAHGNFDNVAKILRKSFYVDNCVTSFETEEQLQKFIVESKIL
ncbi:integrase catalytic domain-containing protein [Trichonephila clavipes]|nr:integrase catalytic domain-containing protein [Trichonephila clavipes]